MIVQFLLALSIRFFIFDFVLFKNFRNYLKGKGYFFKKLLSCPFCQGFWCGFGVYLTSHPIIWSVSSLASLLTFGLISAYLSLATAVALDPLIERYEKLPPNSK